MFSLTSECISPREGARLYLSSNHWDATKNVEYTISLDKINITCSVRCFDFQRHGLESRLGLKNQNKNATKAQHAGSWHIICWNLGAGQLQPNMASSTPIPILQYTGSLISLKYLVRLNIQTVQVLHLRMPPQSMSSQWFPSVFCVLYTFVFELSFFASMQQSPPGCIPYLGRWGHPAERHSCHGRSNFPSFHLLLQDLQPGKSTQDALAQCHWRSSNQS